MRADNTQEIQDIVTQLQELQLQESELIERLAQLSDGVSHDDTHTNTAVTPTPQINTRPTRDDILIRDSTLVIGSRVQIKNPRFLQPIEGVVTKITNKRVTVQAPNGSTVVRAHKNIILLA